MTSMMDEKLPYRDPDLVEYTEDPLVIDKPDQHDGQATGDADTAVYNEDPMNATGAFSGGPKRQGDQPPEGAGDPKKPKQEGKIDETYWYHDDDLYYALLAELHDLVNVKNVFVLPPVASFELGLDEDPLKWLEDDGIREAVKWYDDTKVVIPYNIGGFHWTGLVVHVNRQGTVTKAVWLDSTNPRHDGAYETAAPEEAVHLCKAVGQFFSSPSVTSSWPGVAPLQQKNDHDCGPCTCANIVNYIRGDMGRAEEDVPKLRRHQLEQLPETVKRLSQVRQQQWSQGKRWTTTTKRGSGEISAAVAEQFDYFLRIARQAKKEVTWENFQEYVGMFEFKQEPTETQWNSLMRATFPGVNLQDPNAVKQALQERELDSKIAFQHRQVRWPREDTEISDVVKYVLVHDCEEELDSEDCDGYTTKFLKQKYKKWGQWKKNFEQDKNEWAVEAKSWGLAAAFYNNLYALLKHDQGVVRTLPEAPKSGAYNPAAYTSPAHFLKSLRDQEFYYVLYNLKTVLVGQYDPQIPSTWYSAVEMFGAKGYQRWGDIAAVTKEELVKVGFDVGAAAGLLNFIQVMDVPYPSDFWQEVMTWGGHPGDGALVHVNIGGYAQPPEYKVLRDTQEERFDFTNGIMERQVSRDVYKKLYTMALNADRRDVYLHLYGPAGIGKSHALYSAAIALRYKNGNLRVPYLPNCDQWGQCKAAKPGQYFISAFRDAFIGDPEIFRALGRVDAEDEGEVHEFFKTELPRLLDKASLYMLVIIDQINKLPSGLVTQFPYDMVTVLAKSRVFKERGSIACAGSTSSFAVKEDPMNIFYFWPKMTHFAGFPKAEFAAWRESTRAFPAATPDQLEEVERLTNMIPNELKLLEKDMEMAKFEESVQAFVWKRKNDIKQRTGEWVRQVLQNDDAEKRLAARAAVFMHAEAPVKGSYTTDERFMMPPSRGKTVQYSDGQKHVAGVIAPLTPVIGDAIYEYWRHTKGDIVINALVDILKGDYTSDTKGRLWEKIIIDGLVADRQNGLGINVHPIKGSKVKGKKTVPLMVSSFDEVLHFKGLDVPALSRDLLRGRRVLLVPLMPNFPHVDVLLWDGTTKTLWALQITVRDPIKGHACRFYEGGVAGGSDGWENAIQTALNKSITIEFVWVGNNDTIPNDGSWDGDNWVHIKDFSVVRSPVLQECIEAVFKK